MMTRFLWMSVLVAAGSWGCGGSSQSTDNTGAGGSNGTSGASANAGNAGKSSTGSGGKGSATSGGAGNSTAGSSSTGGGASNAGSTSTAGGTSVGGLGSGTGVTACDNGKDDDGDGLIDGFDPECTGPLDNDEGTFATGIPGDNRDPKWQDCFFDGNSGAGDDNCRYATGCLTGDLPQTDKDCTLTDACIKFCAPLTQNGCDCFGCCTVTLPDGSHVDVTESATCSLANVLDEKACPRCVKNTQCGNTCGECELCPGKTVADLPAKCTPTGSGGASGAGGSPNAGGAPSNGGAGGAPATGGSGGVTWSCDGQQTCGPNLPPCAGNGEYCSLGCCIPSIR